MPTDSARRIFLAVAATVAAVTLLALVVPGARGVPGVASPLAPIPATEAVRVQRAGYTLVYDKRESYAVAELVERWPSVACQLFPGDRIEIGGEGFEVEADVHVPWWR